MRPQEVTSKRQLKMAISSQRISILVLIDHRYNIHFHPIARSLWYTVVLVKGSRLSRRCLGNRLNNWRVNKISRQVSG